MVEAPITEEPVQVDVAVAQPDVAEPVIEAAPIAPVTQEEVAPVAPVVVAEAVVEPASVAAVPVTVHSHATAPMTRAPAPDYEPEAPRQSDWQRPAFDFEGKGAAGGHSATHQATAPATRPQPVE